jgi:hypothetical protein
MATTPVKSPGPPPTLDLLSTNLFRIVSLILLFVAILLIVGLGIQTYSYFGGLHAATAVQVPNNAVRAPVDLVDHAAVIAYARGLGAAFIKTSALFLGFILIFTGTLYVLRTAEAAYQIHVTGGTVQGSLQTTSPGLVIATLGVVLTIVTLMTKSDLDYEKTTEVGGKPIPTASTTDSLIKPGTLSLAPSEPANEDTSPQGKHQ